MALPQTVFWRERKAGRLPIFPRTLNSESAAVPFVSGTVFPGIFIDEGKVYGHHNGMGRPHRTQAGGLVYHVLNRANRRAPIFNESGDYGETFPLAKYRAQVGPSTKAIARKPTPPF